MKVYVDYKSTVRESSSGDASKYEHSWEAEKDLNVLGVYKDRKHCRSWEVEEMNVLDSEIGDTLFIVVVRYSDGDTFGHSTGNFDFVQIVKTAEQAVKLRGFIAANKYKKYMCLGKGQRREVHLSWTGYFNSLESIEIHKLELY